MTIGVEHGKQLTLSAARGGFWGLLAALLAKSSPLAHCPRSLSGNCTTRFIGVYYRRRAKLAVKNKKTLTAAVSVMVISALFLSSCSLPTVETQPTGVPKPEPVKSDYLVGAYYWVSWDTKEVLTHFMDWNDSMFEPLLGKYDSTNTEVVNWHIKWAVEHGISFFAVQFYETQLKAGFMRAEFLPYIKFAFIAPVELGVDEDESRIVNQIDWMSLYFQNPCYLRIENRPVVFMLIRYNSDQSKVDENEKANLLEKIRKAKSYHGFLATRPFLVGVYSINSGDWNLTIPELSQEFDAVTLYNAGLAGGEAPYDTMVSAYTSLWSQWSDAARELSVPIIPSAIPGFDDTLSYEHKTRDWIVSRTGASPSKFEQMLEGVKHYADGRLKMLLITAWNEFAEGSVIEPTKDNGFSYLNVIRDMFTERPSAGYPPDIIPSNNQ